ncbi:MAG: threonine-phosphate decarboxylase CobD [Thermodesulfovibrionales bacterium]|nr:threonine-phosphate decarboxylase CobD [Thermodesulfovibrionales bacterium]
MTEERKSARQHCELHGGNIYRLAESLGIDENEIIDFSASINPLGVPESVISEIKDNFKYLYNYPDPDSKQLQLWIAKHLAIDSQSIICGNGSTELIYLIARALKPGKVLIPAPTFSEYERACRTTSYELRVKSYELKKENNFDIDPEEFISAMKGNGNSELRTLNSELTCEMAFLCNPNNPTGRLLEKEGVLKIANAAKRLKCYLIVDEAFIDFSPDESVMTTVRHNPYLIVLRSLTKFYALSGLRIGYGVFPLNIIETIKRHKEPWTVNTLAQAAGIAAFKDIEYKRKTFMLIKQEKDFLEKEFKRLKINYVPSEANYYLLRLNAKKIMPALRDKGILVRDCSNFAGLDGSYIRIAVKSREDNMQLLKELSNFSTNCHPEFISGSQKMLKQACPEEILNQVQNDTFRVQHDKTGRI